jgi:hypothetical protein
VQRAQEGLVGYLHRGCAELHGSEIQSVMKPVIDSMFRYDRIELIFLTAHEEWIMKEARHIRGGFFRSLGKS